MASSTPSKGGLDFELHTVPTNPTVATLQGSSGSVPTLPAISNSPRRSLAPSASQGNSYATRTTIGLGRGQKSLPDSVIRYLQEQKADAAKDDPRQRGLYTQVLKSSFDLNPVGPTRTRVRHRGGTRSPDKGRSSPSGLVRLSPDPAGPSGSNVVPLGRLSPGKLSPETRSPGRDGSPSPTGRRKQRSPEQRKQRKHTRMLAKNAASLLEADRPMDASKLYLSGLERWPSDRRLQRGFEEVVGVVKLVEAPQRWARWPYVPFRGPAERVAVQGDPPGQLPPPWASHIGANATVEITWEASPMEDEAQQYELEVLEVNPLTGKNPWRRAYKGNPPKTFAAVPMRREIGSMYARVRAKNNRGTGEWSESSKVMVRPPPEPIERVEIDEIPATWLAVDMGGITELNEKEINDALLNLTKEELLRALYQNRTCIKVAFRYYALAGVSSVDDDPNTMTMLQFGNFCRGANLVDAKLSSSDIDRLFLRAVRVLPPKPSDGPPTKGKGKDDALGAGLAGALAATGITAKHDKEWKKLKAAQNVIGLISKGGNLMAQHQFVGALIRMASQRYPEAETSLADKLTRLCKEHIDEHVFTELALIDDAFAERMRSVMMSAVLVRHAASLRMIFSYYSAADTLSSAEAKRALKTMNVRECNEMIEDAGIYDTQFSVREVLAAFVKVNIDDDLYYQEEAENNSSELVYDEFEEVIARVFHAAVWVRMQDTANTAALLDQDGDGDFDEDDVDDLFDECDEDGSGSVSLVELEEALAKRINAGAAKLVAEQLMELADDDGGGTMDREELRAAFRKINEQKEERAEEAAETKEGALERMMDTWLEKSFVPPLLTAIERARKKKAKGEAPAAA